MNLVSEPEWLEDDEPPCCLVDAWGQGCMTIQMASPRPISTRATPLLCGIVEEQL